MRHHTKDLAQRAEDIANKEEMRVWSETGDFMLSLLAGAEAYEQVLREIHFDPSLATN